MLFPRTHLIERHKARSGGESWKFLDVESILMWILQILSDIAFYLISSNHPLQISQPLLLLIKAIGIALEAAGGYVYVVLGVKEMGSGPVEIELMDVPAQIRFYLSTIEQFTRQVPTVGYSTSDFVLLEQLSFSFSFFRVIFDFSASYDQTSCVFYRTKTLLGTLLEPSLVI